MIARAPRRILFVGVSLRRGGAERVSTLLLQKLASAGADDLHLALLDRDGPFLNELPAAVTVHTIGTRQPVAALFRLFRLLKQLEPDVIFSNGFPVNLLTTSLKPALRRPTRLVIREVNVLDALLRQGLSRPVLRRTARRAFPRADAIICQSRFMQQDLLSGLQLDPGKLVTIFNPVDFDAIARRGAESSPFAAHGPGPHLLGLGQLARKKGFDRLIRALPDLLHQRPSAQLWLVGDGPQRRPLQQLAARLGVDSRVHFPGQTENPFAWMRNTDLFVLASHHEGTPNVLLEAIACQAPVVVLDHPGGTREVLQRTGQEWRIVDDLNVWDPRWFAPPPAEALERAREFLDVSHVARQYLDVLVGAPAQREAA